ncbi:SAUR family protein [Vigna unguiculata]|uniref:SAUR family protein n=1 Tax=Vigna unguiculata TaxID=3917 RepID=A0A4D6MG54_VIGUN|nr:SAUR family protein [Vigna unguiculata]
MAIKRRQKGHFVVYTIDKARFVLPLTYLRNNVFRELLRMSEEHLGLPTQGPIILPCHAPFMDYLLSLLRKHASFHLHTYVCPSCSYSYLIITTSIFLP